MVRPCAPKTLRFARRGDPVINAWRAGRAELRREACRARPAAPAASNAASPAAAPAAPSPEVEGPFPTLSREAWLARFAPKTAEGSA